MGLPLFVAPVESDSVGRLADKAATSHVRSSIRRTQYNNVRESRAARRRYEAGRSDREPELLRRLNDEGSGLPWMDASAESPEIPSYPVLEGNPHLPGGMQVATGPPHVPDGPVDSEADPSDWNPAGLARAAENNVQLSSLLGEQWSQLHARLSNSVSAIDEGRHALDDSRRTRDRAWLERRRLLAARDEYAYVRDLAANDRRARRNHIAPSVMARFDRSPPRRRTPYYAIRGGSRTHPSRSVSFRDYAMNHREGMDGLGDRDRSLSPEGDGVWDTLLSTLTPDPQPPSVGSSFASASASAAASQSAAGSSSTSLTGPETADEVAAEQACESGCEHSDCEDHEDDAVHSGPAADLSGQALRTVRSRSVPEYNLDGPTDQPTLGNPSRTSSRRSRRAPSFGRVSNDYPPTAGDGGASPNMNSQSDDDPWGGMQRIVRNLARREDIPDEWWAAAGLSRTLPQDPSNQ